MGGGGGEGFVRRGDGWVYWGVEVLRFRDGDCGWMDLGVRCGSFCCHAM